MKICPKCHAKFEDSITECPKDNTALPANDRPNLIGTCLADRYQVLSVIGSGGTGIVYQAHHLKMDRLVAIKMMHSHMVARPDALKSFYAEAKTVASLKHHNIVTLYDFGMGPDNQPFLVMDYIEGRSLKKAVQQDGPISLEQMRFILDQIVDGLAYAHAEGIVHQDLKPENIMLTPINNSPDKITLVDFGMAALNEPDKDMAISGNKKKKFVGSPHYMSPEQCLSSANIDNRSDVYSLSFVLYEALSGKLPFEAKSGIAMMDSHVREIPKPFKESGPEVPSLQVCTELTRVFNKAMAKEPDSRQENIIEFGVELNEALARDAVKVKAVKHRTIAAEQVLVHAQTINRQQAIDLSSYKESQNNPNLNAQVHSGRQFLSRQAAIEAAYLHQDETDTSSQDEKDISSQEETNTSSQDFSSSPRDNIIVRLLKKMRLICSKPAVNIATNPTEINREFIQCPYCQATVTRGVQFCLTCQRKLTASSITHKLSANRSGNAFTFHQLSALEEDISNIATKSNIQNLRQLRQLSNMGKIQRVLNYALGIGIILGGIVILQSYLDMSKSWHTISHFVHLPNMRSNARFR